MYSLISAYLTNVHVTIMQVIKSKTDSILRAPHEFLPDTGLPSQLAVTTVTLSIVIVSISCSFMT